MKFSEALGLCRGITAVIGSGGKSSLLNTLATELRDRGTVVLCTTTHMFPPEHMCTLQRADAETVTRALSRDGAVCAGELACDGRLHSPLLPISELALLADYVLVEADGSKRLPLKAHAPHEPVIPEATARTVCVVGLSGIGRPVSETVLRPERFAALAGCGPEDAVTPELAARVLNREALADIFYLNQADVSGDAAPRLAALLDKPAVWGSLHGRWVQCLY